jgi:antitoxin (DNA-binding transcriptional repressor) of toxin-antitoxin stability system
VIAPEEPVGVQRARKGLGALVDRVATGRTVPLAVKGTAAGALAPLERVHAAGLDIAGAWGIEYVRQNWHEVRGLAVTDGPQAITRRGTAAAVLISPEHAQVLERGHPVLAATELRFDGHQVTDQDGRPIPPGTWAIAGGVLRVESLPEADGQTTTEGTDMT